MSYTPNGKIATTQVPGTSTTGRYAPDGSWNIVSNTAIVPVGLYHPCGALNAFTVTDPSSPANNPNGSLNVIANAQSPSGLSPVYP